MRQSKVLLLVPLMLLFCVGAAQAAFDNSHHDMTTYAAATSGCFQCHGRPTAVTTTALAADLGRVGGLCLTRCHQNVAGVALTPSATLLPTAGANIDTGGAGGTYVPTVGGVNNANYTVVYFSSSHDSLKAALKNAAGTQVALGSGLAATWPYVNSADNAIECTSCHAVHDNANAPFLWAPLASSTSAARDGFCDRCHTERATNSLQAVNPDGNHPVDIVVDNVLSAARTGNTRHGRRINIQVYGAARAFDVANNFTAASMIGAANSWSMGGHLTTGVNTPQINWVPGAGSTTSMGCYTCHSAHRMPVTGENNLTVIANFNDNATGGFNPICVGCHGLSTTWAADSVETGIGTTIYGHPTGANTGTVGGLYTSSVGGITFVVATPVWSAGTTGTNENNQFATGGKIICTSCHKVHFGQAASMSIANLGQAAGKSLCKQCHTGIGIPNVGDMSKGGAASAVNANKPNSHHVTHVGAIGATLGKVGDALVVLNVAVPSWANAATGIGDLSTGMDCADCHVFNGTAHNW